MSDAADSVAVRPVNAQSDGGWAGRWGLDPLRVFKLLLAVLLLPVCASLAVAFHGYFWTLGTKLRVAVVGWPEPFKWFMAGAGLFAAVGILLWRPLPVYVFGREAVRALATWLCMGKATNLRAAATGGQITTSKSNTLIRLMPYILPLYAVLVAVVFVSFDASGRSLRQPELLAALLGATLAFHVGFTLWSLRWGQEDLKQDGWLFSLVLIFLGNVVLLAAFLGLVFTGKASGAWDAIRCVCEEGGRQSLRLFGDLWRDLRQAFRH